MVCRSTTSTPPAIHPIPSITHHSPQPPGPNSATETRQPEIRLGQREAHGQARSDLQKEGRPQVARQQSHRRYVFTSLTFLPSQLEAHPSLTYHLFTHHLCSKLTRRRQACSSSSSSSRYCWSPCACCPPSGTTSWASWRASVWFRRTKPSTLWFVRAEGTGRMRP